MLSDVAISIRTLGKCYHIYEQPRDRLLQMLSRGRKQYFRKFWALSDVSFNVMKGETIGIVGRNGSGKSTLLQLICGTLSPTTGSVETNGRIAALLELGSGFSPDFTGRENVYMNAAILGLSEEETDARYEDIVSFADIGDFINQPVKTYSSGMAVRLAFAVAISVDPKILVIDEALAVGDAGFQRKCMRRLDELTNAGVTLLFVSHDTETVKKICGSALYLYDGTVRAHGKAKDVCIEYERDLFGTSKSISSVAGVSVPEPVDDACRLDSDLLTSSEKTYGDGRVTIEAITVTTTDFKNINVIPAGTSFRVTYIATFHQRVAKPVFGMMITNKEGVCVFGVNTTGRAISLKNYQPDDRVRISFKLTNYLGPGIYYLTCGVHSLDHDDGLIYLQRRIDVIILKSLSREGETVAGMAHLVPVIEESSLQQSIVE